MCWHIGEVGTPRCCGGQWDSCCGVCPLGHIPEPLCQEQDVYLALVYLACLEWACLEWAFLE